MPLVLVGQFSWQFLLMTYVLDVVIFLYYIIKAILQKDDVTIREISNIQSNYLKPKFVKDESNECFLVFTNAFIGYIVLGFYYFLTVPNVNSIILIIFVFTNINLLFKVITSTINSFKKDINTYTRNRLLEEVSIGILRISLVIYFVLWALNISVFSAVFQILSFDFLWIYLIILISITLFIITIIIYRFGEKRNIQLEINYLNNRLIYYDSIKNLIYQQESIELKNSLKDQAILIFDEIIKNEKEILEISKKMLFELITQDFQLSSIINSYLVPEERKYVMDLIKEMHDLRNKMKDEKISRFRRNQRDEFIRKEIREIMKNAKYKELEDKIENELRKSNLKITKIMRKLLDWDIREDRKLSKIDAKSRLEQAKNDFTKITNFDVFKKEIYEIFEDENLHRKLTSMCKPQVEQYNELMILKKELDEFTRSKYSRAKYERFRNWIETRLRGFKSDRKESESRKSIKFMDNIIRGIFWLTSNGIIILIKQFL